MSNYILPEIGVIFQVLHQNKIIGSSDQKLVVLVVLEGYLVVIFGTNYKNLIQIARAVFVSRPKSTTTHSDQNAKHVIFRDKY